jgi:pilus assembly protein CpaD
MTENKKTVASRRRAAGRAVQWVALVGVALSLVGCNTARQQAAEAVPADYRKRHPISIREGNRKIEIFVGTNRGGLTPSQSADVLAFARTWRNESTGGIVVDVPAGAPNEVAAKGALREIRSILAAAGVPPQGVSVQPYTPLDPEQLATIRLSYPKIVAETGPCGLWPEDLGPTTDPVYTLNRPYWNLGCANQRNLAAMVANPADLVQPRGEAPAYSPRRNVVLDKYRKGESTEATYPNLDKAKITNIGK